MFQYPVFITCINHAIFACLCCYNRLVPLKLIQVNIEGSKHWDKVLPFLESEQADVLCLQEVFDYELEKLEAMGYQTVFAPISTKPRGLIDGNSPAPEGIALCSKIPFRWHDISAYYDAPHGYELQPQDGGDKRPYTNQQVVAMAIETEEQEYVLATTHFTWTPDGSASPDQDTDLISLLNYLDRFPALILTGDFNAPRGFNRVYDQLARRYQDQVPTSITSTIDVDLHRNGHIPKERARMEQFVVDYIFSTPDYLVEDIRLQCGVSDHCALVAQISRA